MDTEQRLQIAGLNDRFRRGGYGVVITQDARALQDLPGLLRSVREFEAFDADNDPYGEHDFGSITWDVQKVFWKIDYYDEALAFGEYPLSRKCRRVITVMLSSEY